MRACLTLFAVCSIQIVLVESSAISRFTGFLRPRNLRAPSLSNRGLRSTKKKHLEDPVATAESSRWPNPFGPYGYPYPPRINIRFEEDDTAAEKIRYVYGDDDDAFSNVKVSKRKPKKKTRLRKHKFNEGLALDGEDHLTGGWDWWSMRRMMASLMVPPLDADRDDFVNHDEEENEEED